MARQRALGRRMLLANLDAIPATGARLLGYPPEGQGRDRRTGQRGDRAGSEKGCEIGHLEISAMRCRENPAARSKA